MRLHKKKVCSVAVCRCRTQAGAAKAGSKLCCLQRALKQRVRPFPLTRAACHRAVPSHRPRRGHHRPAGGCRCSQVPRRLRSNYVFPCAHASLTPPQQQHAAPSSGCEARRRTRRGGKQTQCVRPAGRPVPLGARCGQRASTSQASRDRPAPVRQEGCSSGLACQASSMARSSRVNGKHGACGSSTVAVRVWRSRAMRSRARKGVILVPLTRVIAVPSTRTPRTLESPDVARTAWTCGPNGSGHVAGRHGHVARTAHTCGPDGPDGLVCWNGQPGRPTILTSRLWPARTARRVAQTCGPGQPGHVWPGQWPRRPEGPVCWVAGGPNCGPNSPDALALKA